MGKFLKSKWSSLFLVLMFAVAVGVLSGCSGDTGPQGPAGVQGPAGPAGPQGEPAFQTAESCNVCHGTGAGGAAVLNVAAVHAPALIKPDVTNIVVARDAADVLTVTFHVSYVNSQNNTVNLPGLSTNAFRVYMADLVPAGTATANLPQSTWGDPVWWPTGMFEIWAEDRASTAGVVITDLTNGDYSFQMGTLATDATILAPEADITLDTQRVYVRADAREMAGFDRTMGVADFMMPAQAADTGVIDTTTRTIVVAEACTACHSDPLQRAAHGAGYQSPQVCNMCHSPIGDNGDLMQADGFWLARLIHGIHSANDFATSIDFTEITYPKNIKNCEVCHFDAGQDLAGAWKSNPTIEVCTSCHNVTFTGAATHSGGVQDDSTCRLCHPADGAGVGMSVAGAHNVTTLKHNPDGTDTPVSIVPNYRSYIELSPDANADGVYDAGEQIMITVTVKEGIDPANPDLGPYVGPDVTFRAASLYVYGSRAKAVPVLTTGSTTDPNYDPAAGLPTQSHSLLEGSTDPQVMTDADGFKYQTLAIPADMTPGTYMVLVSVTDVNECSGVYRGNTCIDGWANVTFQVGTATEQDRVAGVCTACHTQEDWGSMYHRSYFGTDGCLACHDQSGNHADPIANRVHAVHSASGSGDLLGLAWDGSDPDIEAPTFPQNADYCVGCHNSGDTSYNTAPVVWSVPCIGCHGDTAGAYDHVMQNGAPINPWFPGDNY